MQKKIYILVCLISFQAWGGSHFQVPYTVKEKELVDLVLLSGTIAPLNSETVRAEWYSLVKRFGVELGQRVKKGDLIAEVELKYMEAKVDYLKTRIQFLAAQLDQAESDERDSNREHSRLRKLASKEIVNRSEVENDELKVLDSRLGRIKAEKELRDSKDKLKETQLQIRQANYYAPVDGVITDLAVNPKQLVGAYAANKGVKLARIDQSGRYIVKCLAFDTHVISLKADSPAKVILEGSNEVFDAKILQILRSETLNEEGINLFEVSVVFDRPGPILNRDLLARVEIPFGFPVKGPTVPWNAITVTSKGNFVRVAESSQGWTERQVELGLRGPHEVLIRSGVKAGDVVQAALW